MAQPEVVIIGAGPAGVTAAIQLKRYGIPFSLLEQDRVGGLLWSANLVENYPGFPHGISGRKLVGLIEKQLEHAGVEVSFEKVHSLEHAENCWLVRTGKATYQSRFVVMASGTVPLQQPFSIPQEASNRVFSEVYPLLEFHGKHIVIVGAGDAAFDYALNLTKNRNSVTILNRKEKVQCLRPLWERAVAEPLITYRSRATVSCADVEQTGRYLTIQLADGERLRANYLLFAIGRLPNTEFAPEGFENKEGEGLYLVGDVKNGPFRQAAIAAGDGLRAAMEIHMRTSAEVLDS